MIVKLANVGAIRRDSIDNRLSSNEIKAMFDEFLLQFERMERSGNITRNIFYDAVEEITNAILFIAPRKLVDSRLLHHPLISLLHQLLISFLDKWCMSPYRINIQEMDIFLEIILIFVQVAEQLLAESTDENRSRLEDIWTIKQFRFQVREQIDDVVENEQYLNDDRNIYALGLLTIKMLQDSPFYYQLGRNERLMEDLALNSIDSYDFTQVMRQLRSGKPVTRIEHYLLLTCWEYLSSASFTTHDLSTEITTVNLIYYISDILLTQLAHALDESPMITPPVFRYILERYSHLINIQSLPSLDKHANYIVLYLSNILQNSSTTNDQDHAIIALALGALYNLANNSDIRSIIRKHHLTSLFNKYTSTHIEQETRQIALGILAQTMDEQEINKNRAKITAVFLDQLKQLHPNTYNPHLDSVLSSLRVLMQHEQVKNEFVRQGGLHILIAFVRDGDPDKQYPQQLEDALAILWSCTFNNPQVLKMLQQDAQLMVRINQLVDNAKHHGNSSLEKAAEGVIWKVEKEEKFEQQLQEKERKSRTTTSEEEDEGEEEQYDCMISYSWSDMDLAHRIFHHLTDKLGYKIWLDQEQMHGSTIETMANAVENAQFILMCMSETYKQSANCQSEAEYAFKRKKYIIPIRMKEDYTADGWLGFILGTRMYIDFGKYDFEKAMELLHNEIQLQKKRRKEAKGLAKTTKEDEADYQSDEDGDIDGKMDINNILNWNETVVRDFLTKTDLSDFIPLCEGINGEELLDLYGMCKSSSVTMYRSLKFELFNKHEKILPISTFLHFIRRLRVVDGSDLPLNLYIYSEHLVEHSEDDE